MTDFERMAELERLREESQDDETRGHIRLARLNTAPLLANNQWEQIHDGEDGLGAWDFRKRGLRLIHSIAREQDGDVWAHLSLSRRDRQMPTWEQLRNVWWMVHPGVYGVIVVAPEVAHVNISEVGHVWGNLSRPAVPDFTRGLGTI